MPFGQKAKDLTRSTGAPCLKIAVSSPPAVLEALILSPGDYGLRIDTRTTTRRDGSPDLKWDFTSHALSTARQGSPKGTIFLLHAYGAMKESLLPWGLILAEAGYRVVLVDLRGHGRSTGELFSLGKFETADMIEVLDDLSRRGLCDHVVGVMGWSFGADLAMFWGARDQRVKSVVAIAAYDRPDVAFQRAAKSESKSVSEEDLQAGFTIAARKLSVNWSDWVGSTALREYGRPVLLIGGGRDRVSPPSDLQALEQTAPPGSKVLVLKDADHLNVGYWFEELRCPVVNWFDQHMGASDVSRGN